MKLKAIRIFHTYKKGYLIYFSLRERKGTLYKSVNAFLTTKLYHQDFILNLFFELFIIKKGT